MIYQFLNIQFDFNMIFAAIVAGFIITVIAMKKALLTLPKDQGRKFAVNGELSKGKPRGGGVVFVIIFSIIALLFIPLTPEFGINYLLIAAAMLTGYLDDMSKIPWGELKKGLLDLMICVIAVVTYCNFDGNYTIYFFGGAELALPPVLYMLIAVFFLWVSINVTNCTDGVDGLLGSLSIVTMISLACIFYLTAQTTELGLCLIFAAILLGYLAYNASP
ncbi:MAG: phospho-N-acetylmuramoyl-pentapeptide-transferase, partial [Oscillospiraceae bacterium]|nr:phospho-N-acetylmuramoyl-pentapeptide-transferase [Oscillospiraceae bacterium]